MTFTQGTKVYVSYVSDISGPTVERLTIKKFQNDLLYFQEKSLYYAVECHSASFYGYSRTMAGKILVTKYRWQLPFAALAEKMVIAQPVQPVKRTERRKLSVTPELSKVS